MAVVIMPIIRSTRIDDNRIRCSALVVQCGPEEVRWFPCALDGCGYYAHHQEYKICPQTTYGVLHWSCSVVLRK
jgi:hypothetical protein